MREKIRKKDWKDKTRVYEGKSKKEKSQLIKEKNGKIATVRKEKK